MKIRILGLFVVCLFLSCETFDAFVEKLAVSSGSETTNGNAAAARPGAKTNTAQRSRTRQPERKAPAVRTDTASRLTLSYTLPASYDTAYSYRTDTPNQNMRNIPRNIEANRTKNPDEYIRQVVELINNKAKNDFEKVKMAHDIVALVIKYDAANFWAGRIPNQSYQSVLKNRLAVCEGYSNTFKKFCDALKIPCEVVHGFGRGVGTSPLAGDTPNDSNHAWNIVAINGGSYLVDCTWDSGYMDGRTAKQVYTTDWLFLKPEHFLHTHYPENAKQQLLAAPLNAAQFSALPFFKPKFFELANDISIKLQKINQIDNALSFDYTIKEGYRLVFSVNDIKTGREIQNRYFVQSNGTKETVYFSFPTAGQYSINAFGFKTGARRGEGCGEFIVETSSANAVQYPLTYPSSAQNLQIISPMEAPLKKGNVYTFKIRVDNKNVVAIIYGRTFVQLTKGTDGIFSTDFQIPNNINDLSIGVATSERARYESIARYSVN